MTAESIGLHTTPSNKRIFIATFTKSKFVDKIPLRFLENIVKGCGIEV
jgi:hypothetical protein